MPGRTMTLRTQTPGGQTKPLYTLAELEDAIYAAYMVAPVVCREIGLGGIGERIALERETPTSCTVCDGAGCPDCCQECQGRGCPKCEKERAR